MKKSLDEMIDEAAKLEPGPEAWQPILDAYPLVSITELADRFRQSAQRDIDEADALERYSGANVVDFPDREGASR